MDAAYTGKQISERRKALGLTQKELAEKLHVTDKAVSKWERGINFPDLGLLENLAHMLDTTPAVLLGLENANRDELVTTLTEISNEQAEDAQKDIRFLGWCCIVIALLTLFAYWLFYDRDARATNMGFPMLNFLTMVIAQLGWWPLYKYGEVRHLEPEDLGILALILIPLCILLGVPFLTGYSLNSFLSGLLVALISIGIQLLFCRIFRPDFVKLLPTLCAAFYALWQGLDGNFHGLFLLPALCTAAVSVVFLRKRRKNAP